MIHGLDWVWYAVGVAVAFTLVAATVRARRRRWQRRHSYVAEVEIR